MNAWESPGKSNEWLTPKYIFDALGVMFDMDVVSPPRPTHVAAQHFIIAESLFTTWRGFVWMNPPFGGRSHVLIWLNKFIAHHNGVALVPDRTSAPWFQHAAPQMDAVLFVSPKIKFERPDGSIGNSPGTGTVLMALGPVGTAALRNARGLGWLIVRGEVA